SGFEELWAVLEPGWGVNTSFGQSMSPKALLLGSIYQALREFQSTITSVCVQACGPCLDEVCRRCARAWALLNASSSSSLAACAGGGGLNEMKRAVLELTSIARQYGTSTVVRKLALPLLVAAEADSGVTGDGGLLKEMLSCSEGYDMRPSCTRIATAITMLPDDRSVGDGSENGERARAGVGRRGMTGGQVETELNSDAGQGGAELRLPPCPSYWAKLQFEILTARGLQDLAALLDDPVRLGCLVQLVTRASNEGPDGPHADAVWRTSAWDHVRWSEGPGLRQDLRKAVSKVLMTVGEPVPLQRVPPLPPAFLPRTLLAEKVGCTILHPFLPMGIAGISGSSGTGKTVLASAVVRGVAVRRRFGDRVFWLHAGRGAEGRLVSLLQELAEAIYWWLVDAHGGGYNS
ncbi:unnamed protein product, partial [Choristocarpus tenellus]